MAHRSLEAYFRDKGEYSYEGAIPYFLKRLAGTVDYHQNEAGIIIAWDSGIPLHRRELYPEYKPNSKPVGVTEAKYLSQVNIDGTESTGRESFIKEYQKLVATLHERILPYCNCISIRVDNVEADDIIAFCCFHLKDIEKQIISTDKDLLQLLSETTSVYRFQYSGDTGALHDWDWVCDSYDYVEQFRYAFLIEKAIIGDTSDNIPGIEGIGTKLAKKYAHSVIRNIITYKQSLNEAMYFVERPYRASQKGYNNFRQASDQVKRNIDLMDLYLPIYINLDSVYTIQKNFSTYLNFDIDYEKAMDKLEQVQNFNFNYCFRLIDQIYESNSNYNTKELLVRLRDANPPKLENQVFSESS